MKSCNIQPRSSRRRRRSKQHTHTHNRS